MWDIRRDVKWFELPLAEYETVPKATVSFREIEDSESLCANE